MPEATKKVEARKPELIRVRPKLDDRRVLLHERDEAHPGGEIFISNNGKEYTVAETPAIKLLIGEDKLERVGWNSKTSAEKVEPAPPGGRRPGRPVSTVAPKPVATKPPVSPSAPFMGGERKESTGDNS